MARKECDLQVLHDGFSSSLLQGKQVAHGEFCLHVDAFSAPNTGSKSKGAG